MAKSSGSAGVQRKLRGLAVGAVTYNKGVYSMRVAGGSEMAVSSALRKAGFYASVKPVNEYKWKSDYIVTARRAD